MELEDKRPVEPPGKDVTHCHIVFVIENSDRMNKNYEKTVSDHDRFNGIDRKSDLLDYAIRGFINDEIRKEA